MQSKRQSTIIERKNSNTPSTIPSTDDTPRSSTKQQSSAAAVSGAGDLLEASTHAAVAPTPASAPLAKTLKSMNVVVLGLDGAGKSTVLAALQGDVDPQVSIPCRLRP